MKKKLSIVLTLVVATSLILVGCGQSKKLDEAKATIEKIKIENYMEEDKQEVEKLKKDAVKSIDKAKDKKDIDAAVAKFDKAVKKIPTREAQITAMTKVLNDKVAALNETNKAKAEEIVKSYEKQLKEVKSKADLDKISKEITDKISTETGETIEVVKSEDIKAASTESSDTDNKTEKSENAQGSSTTSKSSRSTSSSHTSNKSSSVSASSSSSSSKASAPAKKQVWVVDKPAWTETVTKTRTRHKSRPTWWIRFEDGSLKTYYDKAEWNYDCEYAPDVGSWGNGDKELVPYEETYTETVNHPEEGHYEWQ